MKKLLLTLLLLTIGISSITAQESYTLTINFTGMESDKGDIYIGIYNKEGNFLKKHFKGAITKVINRKATFTFKNLIKGEYAISAFHDQNDNKEMDTNFIGIPKEPIGISNNAKGFMGPPKYKDAKFSITKNTHLTISIH